jgi:hypothetical protein
LTVKGLRKEIEKGRLEVELIANKHFMILAAIERMRELRKVAPKNFRTDEVRSQRDALPDREGHEGESELERLIRRRREKSEALRREKREQKRRSTT